MHPDEILLEQDARPACATPPAYDPCAFATWAAARTAYPYHALIRIVDLNQGAHFITPIYPQPDCSDIALDGRTYVVGAADCFDKQLSPTELADVLRSYDDAAGPDIPRR